MQAAPIGNSFLQPRADLRSPMGAAQGGPARKPDFESVLKSRAQRDNVPERVYQPQDGRTIRDLKKRDDAKPVDVEAPAGIDTAAGTKKPDPAKETSGEQGEQQDSPEKLPQAATEQSKPEKKDSNEPDPAQAVALALVANEAAAVDPQEPAPQQNGQKPVEASPATVESLQTVLEQGVAADAAAKAATQAGDAVLKQPPPKSAGEKKLNQTVAQMESVPESLQTDVKAVEASAQSETDQESAQLPDQTAEKVVDSPKSAEPKAAPSSFDRELATLQNSVQPSAKPDSSHAAKVQPMPNLTPEQKFVQDNVDQMVTSVRTQAVNGGGQMNVRLDPPELGALSVAVKMIEGRLTASFTTSNEQATQLLSHSLQHLKSSLESSGVNVDRIEVRQAPPTESSNSRSNSDSQQQQQHQRGFDGQSSQSEQNRKEMVRKMWRKLAFGTDELDLVA